MKSDERHDERLSADCNSQKDDQVKKENDFIIEEVEQRISPISRYYQCDQ